MQKPICGNCYQEMARDKSGVTVLYMYLKPPQPYKAWHADLHTCPNCDQEVITGFADQAFWNNWDDTPAPDQRDEWVFVID